MKIVFSSIGWVDYLRWQAEDTQVLSRINELINQSTRTPFSGIGKPEPLVGNLKGFWSRRITREHRLVYRVVGKDDAQALEIASCRFHYER